MAASYDKLDLVQREKVYELKEAGISGAEIARRMAVGFPREDPPVAKVKITPQAINDLYRRQRLERQQLYTRKLATVSTPDALYLLRRKLSLIANAEADRLAALQQKGKLDPEQLRKLVGACERIERLELSVAKREAESSPTPDPARANQPDEGAKDPPTWAETLIKAERENPREKPDIPQGEADPEGQDGAVPHDLPLQTNPEGVS